RQGVGIGGEAGEVVGAVQPGGAVEADAALAHLAGNVLVGGRALEHQVLEQVRHAGLAVVLVARADQVGHVDGGDRLARIGEQHHPHAVVQRVLADALGAEHRLRRRLLAGHGRRGQDECKRKRCQDRRHAPRPDESAGQDAPQPRSEQGKEQSCRRRAGGCRQWTTASTGRWCGALRPPAQSRCCTPTNTWLWSTSRRACWCTTAAWPPANVISWSTACARSSGGGCSPRIAWTAPPAAACCWPSTARPPAPWASSSCRARLPRTTWR